MRSSCLACFSPADASVFLQMHRHPAEQRGREDSGSETSPKGKNNHSKKKSITFLSLFIASVA